MSSFSEEKTRRLGKSSFYFSDGIVFFGCSRVSERFWFFLLFLFFFFLLFITDQYCFHFSKQTNNSHVVKLHVDDRDISYQYSISFGDWEGAKLVCLDSSGGEIGTFCETRRILKFDGSLYHFVRMLNFKGVRFTIVLFQLWSQSKNMPDPIFRTPSYIN